MNSKSLVSPQTTVIEKKNYAKLPSTIALPNLIQIQLDSFRWFQEQGLKTLIQDISPIKDFANTRFELNFLSYELRPREGEKYTEAGCRQRDATYAIPLYIKVRLVIKETGEFKEQDIFVGDIPVMTSNGAFLINGAQRVVVSQLLRSAGIYFTVERKPTSGRNFLCSAKLIPARGAWLEFETSNKGIISAKIDGKLKIPITTILRVIGYETDDDLIKLFADVDNTSDGSYIKTTIEHDPNIRDRTKALEDIYGRIRPGEPFDLEEASSLISNLFFNPQRYSLGRVGRYRLNKRLGLAIPDDKAHQTLTKEDLVEITRHVIRINNGAEAPDDVDHLGNRRLHLVGELIRDQLRVGFLRLERVVRERMSIINPPDSVTPSALININPLVASIREFFGGSQLSQFMDQTNPLAELTHKRRISTLGPGGLSRERAGFDVRDVHHSHYGRICPIETPEGPNIGLIGSLASYASVDEYGFIETPYRKVINELPNSYDDLLGKTAGEDIANKSGKVIVKKGTEITSQLARQLNKLSREIIKVSPFVSDEIVRMSASEEDLYTIAQANARLDDKGQFIRERVGARKGSKFFREIPDKIDFMDISPKQIVGVAACLIPFLEHDDANRALMGSNMQRQAVPVICAESPLVETGIEQQVAQDSGQLVMAKDDSEVLSVTGNRIVLKNKNSEEVIYPLQKFVRTNQGTCINQHPLVNKGDKIKKGQVIADSSATDHGELALGQNLLCAFMSWKGYNYEDAIIISERLVQEDKFSSIHIERYEVEARNTKLGNEEITRDIPNVGEESLRDLDEEGVVRIGALVKAGDILVGKITPKGETELTAEEKLLRAIFGEKALEVKDSSLRIPHGEWGTVIAVSTFSRDKGDELPAGVNIKVRVWVAQKRKVSEGDKLSGRHGNKGVVSCVRPVEDMPYLPDGRPIDIILNPIGVPSRMNLGQLLETHLGKAAHSLGFKAVTPIFEGANETDIEDALATAWIAEKAGAIRFKNDGKEDVIFDKDIARVWLDKQGYNGKEILDGQHPGKSKEACLRLWLEEQGIPSKGLSNDEIIVIKNRLFQKKSIVPPTSGKTILYDGETGEQFAQPVTVGYIYMMKLIHLVEDKVHARSTGPYSLVTQQPLGGKAQFGGQRLGEMEVWALEAYGAKYTLQELLTIKSDDVSGRAKAYEAIIKGQDIMPPGLPESFKVLVKELQSLSLSVETISDNGTETELTDREAEPITLTGETKLADFNHVENIIEPATEQKQESEEEIEIEQEPETEEVVVIKEEGKNA